MMRMTWPNALVIVGLVLVVGGACALFGWLTVIIGSGAVLVWAGLAMS